VLVYHWPVPLLAAAAVGGTLYEARRTPAPVAPAVRRRLIIGAMFPLALLVLAFGCALVEADEIPLIGGVSVIAPLIGQIAFAVWSVARSRHARLLVGLAMFAALCVTLTILPPVVGLATGFGRSWK